MGKFHVSSDSDYEPTEQEKAQLRKEKAQRMQEKKEKAQRIKEKREKAQRMKEEKEKAVQRIKETKEKEERKAANEKEERKETKEKGLGKRMKKTRARKYPLLSNYLRLYFPEEARVEKYLRMIPKQDCISFENSWDKIYQYEFLIAHKLENLAYRFRCLVIKHLKP